MPAFPRTFAVVLLALALAAAPGCERLFDKGSKEDVAAAQKKAAAGDFAGAVQLYEASLDGTEKTAESHYKLALLYSDKLKKPLDALHHIDRYVELAPGGAHVKDAANLRKENDSKLRLKLSDGSPSTQAEAVRLKNENQLLLEKIEMLRTQKNAPLASPGAKGEAAQKPVPPGSRTYTVKPKDTLAKIARALYKNAARAKDIQDANFNQLSGTANIKPGMVLIIPK